MVRYEQTPSKWLVQYIMNGVSLWFGHVLYGYTWPHRNKSYYLGVRHRSFYALKRTVSYELRLCQYWEGNGY